MAKVTATGPLFATTCRGALFCLPLMVALRPGLGAYERSTVPMQGVLAHTWWCSFWPCSRSARPPLRPHLPLQPSQPCPAQPWRKTSVCLSQQHPWPCDNWPLPPQPHDAPRGTHVHESFLSGVPPSVSVAGELHMGGGCHIYGVCSAGGAAVGARGTEAWAAVAGGTLGS